MTAHASHRVYHGRLWSFPKHFLSWLCRKKTQFFLLFLFQLPWLACFESLGRETFRCLSELGLAFCLVLPLSLKPFSWRSTAACLPATRMGKRNQWLRTCSNSKTRSRNIGISFGSVHGKIHTFCWFQEKTCFYVSSPEKKWQTSYFLWCWWWKSVLRIFTWYDVRYCWCYISITILNFDNKITVCIVFWKQNQGT